MPALSLGSICIVNDERCNKSICTHESSNFRAISGLLSWQHLVYQGKKIRMWDGTCSHFNLILTCLICGLFMTGQFPGNLLLLLFFDSTRSSLQFTGFLWLPSGMWDLSSQIRDQTCIPCIGGQIPSHWTTREVPQGIYLNNMSEEFYCLLSVRGSLPYFRWSCLAV